ncbi:ABC transporter ATP-binding protein [Halovulum dunhuangense]|uniref:ABC transporter ATP-binding protein n=2 Tax=Halovulum dunhuangense TaxID=1505036 RepID=A0A849L0Y0_9RHOB|nr:ABC transporter ATP-binding protein [Halovulum dunhuangense]
MRGTPCGTGTVPRALSLRGVDKTFATRDGQPLRVLSDITLDVGPGTFVALLGPSGCGKTTVLRLANGLIQPDAGSVEVFGAPARPGPDMGFVFQSFRLIPWATVRANVDFALRALPLADAERAERADRYIAMVGLSRFADSYPRELSGGMKQRVALARAFACEPRILLMDEPFASIDAQTRELMQIELMRLWMLQRSMVLFVTHSVDEAILLADRIVLMGPRPGRIMETLDVDLPRPRWTYDVRSDPRYRTLRAHLARRMFELVMNDPHSEFFGRDLTGHWTPDSPDG